jgi:hypothetical protein
MRRLSHRAPGRYGYLHLPLFAWAARHRAVQLTPGGRAVAKRIGLPPSLANVIAELAGVGPERSL